MGDGEINLSEIKIYDANGNMIPFDEVDSITAEDVANLVGKADQTLINIPKEMSFTVTIDNADVNDRLLRKWAMPLPKKKKKVRTKPSKKLKWCRTYVTCSNLAAYGRTKSIRDKNWKRVMKMNVQMIKRWGGIPFPPEWEK